MTSEFINAETSVFPLLTALPMGFSWSLYFVESAHEAVVDEEGGMSQKNRITDFKSGVKLRHGRRRHPEYVDNVAALGESPDEVNTSGYQMRAAMRPLSLVTRKHEDAGTGMADLVRSVSATPGRPWRLRDGLYVWNGSPGAVGTCRALLPRSSVHRCQFLERAVPSWKLTVTVRRLSGVRYGRSLELRHGLGHPTVHTHDARGIVARDVWVLAPRGRMRSELARRTDAEIGRQEERWVFKLSDCIEAATRECALSETTDADVRGEWKHVPNRLLDPFSLATCQVQSCPQFRCANQLGRR